MTREEMADSIIGVIDEVFEVSPEEWNVEKIQVLFGGWHLFTAVRSADPGLTEAELNKLILEENLLPMAMRLFRADGLAQTQIFSWIKLTSEQDEIICSTNWVVALGERESVN